MKIGAIIPDHLPFRETERKKTNVNYNEDYDSNRSITECIIKKDNQHDEDTSWSET